MQINTNINIHMNINLHKYLERERGGERERESESESEKSHEGMLLVTFQTPLLATASSRKSSSACAIGSWNSVGSGQY